MQYLHLGNNKSVKTETVLGIFDLDTATVSPITKKFLSQAEKKGLLQTVADELPKSFVLIADKIKPNTVFPKQQQHANHGTRVYLTQPAPQTLAQRAERNSQQNV